MKKHPTSNIELPTSNNGWCVPRSCHWALDVGCWMLDVLPNEFFPDHSDSGRRLSRGIWRGGVSRPAPLARRAGGFAAGADGVCGVRTDLATISLLAVLGGSWFDALSANPFGASILPLFAVGFVIYLRRDLILRELSFAPTRPRHPGQCHCAGAVHFAFVDGRETTPAGLGFALAMAGDDCGRRGGDAVGFRAVRLVQPRARLSARTETSFRPDREIRRGRL